MNNEGAPQGPPPITEGQLPPPQEQLLNASNELSESDRLMSIINRLSENENKQGTIIQNHEQVEQRVEELRVQNYTNLEKRVIIGERLNDLRNLRTILFSDKPPEGMSPSDFVLYKKQIAEKVSELLGLKENTSSALYLGIEDQIKKPIADEDEKIYEKESATNAEKEQMAKTKIIDILETNHIDLLIFNLERGVSSYIESNRSSDNFIEVEKVYG